MNYIKIEQTDKQEFNCSIEFEERDLNYGEFLAFSLYMLGKGLIEHNNLRPETVRAIYQSVLKLLES